MAEFPNVREAVKNARTTRGTISKSDLDLSPGAPGVRTSIAETQFDRPHSIIPDGVVNLAIMAYEESTAGGGAPETFNLSHNLVDSGATDQSVIVYVNGSQVDPASVDFANDSVDVNTNNGDTVGIYYAAGDQAQVEIQKTAPNGTHETLWSGDMGLIHLRDHGKEPVRFGLTQEFWTPIVPQDWTLQIYVNAPYTARWTKDIDGDGDQEPAINALASVPVRQATENIDGLKEAVRINAAEQ